MTPAVAYDLPLLLQKAGARLVGRERFDCPKCHRKRTGSYHDEVFYCHGCGYKGNSVSLAKELCLARPMSREEYRAIRLQRERAHEAATLSVALRRARRWQLYDQHQTLLGIHAGATRALRREPENETAWAALAFAFCELPKTRAELLLLECAPFAERRAFMRASRTERTTAIERIIEHGGLTDLDNRFVELTDPAPFQYGIPERTTRP